MLQALDTSGTMFFQHLVEAEADINYLIYNTKTRVDLEKEVEYKHIDIIQLQWNARLFRFHLLPTRLTRQSILLTP